MFRKLFGRSLETNIEATKVELMTDLLAGLRKAYNKYAAIAWLNIEDDGDEKLRQTATLAMHAFDVGFYGTAAALLEARSLAADFKRHPEYVDFGLEVARQAFSREYDAENLVPTVMDIVGNPKHELHSHVVRAYEVGQNEGFNAAQAVMDDEFNAMTYGVYSKGASFDVLKDAMEKVNY